MTPRVTLRQALEDPALLARSIATRKSFIIDQRPFRGFGNRWDDNYRKACGREFKLMCRQSNVGNVARSS